MKYKANHNLLLPDGKTEVKAGEIFEYNGSTEGFSHIIEPVVEVTEPVKIPEENENPDEHPAAFGLEGLSEEEIRAQGKAWKIKNAHNLNIETLKARIYEAYEKAAPAPENETEGNGEANAGE